MSTNPVDDATLSGDVASALAEPSIASLRTSGAPVIVASGAPFHVVWGNDAACALFGVADSGALTQRLAGAADPGARRLVELARSLLPGAASRLERLRFFLDGHSQVLTFMCRRMAGAEPLFVTAALGVRPQVKETRPVSVAASAPVAVPDSPVTEAPTPESDTVRPATAPSLTIVPKAADVDATPAVVDTTTDAGFQVAQDDQTETGNTEQETQSEIVSAPVAEVGPAPVVRSHPEFVADMASRFAGQRRMRFLWQTDAQDRFDKFGETLAHVIGKSVESLIGAPTQALIDRLGLSNEGELAKALATRHTFSGLEVLWPIDTTESAAPVTLGGSPAFDRARQYEGFRGFGFIHLDRVVEQIRETAATPDVGAPVDAATAATETHSEAEQPAHIETLETHSTESITPPADLPSATEKPHNGATATVVEPVHIEEPQPETATPPDNASPEPMADHVVEAESTDVAETPSPLATSPAEPDAPSEAGRLGDNVFHLRPLRSPNRSGTNSSNGAPGSEQSDEYAADATTSAPGSPTGAATVSSTPQSDAFQPTPESIALSYSERNAFREIARALGAKVKTDSELKVEQVKADARPPVAPESAAPSPSAIEAKRRETEAGLARIRDLLQIATSQDAPTVPAPPEPTPLEPSQHELPLVAAPPQASQVAAIHDESLAANAQALFDRLPFGVLVSRGAVPIFVNRSLLDSLGYRDADDLHASGGLERMFRGREPDALTKEADGGAIPVVASNGEVAPFEVRMQTLDWGQTPASMMTFRRTAEPEQTQRVKSLELDLRQRDTERRELHAILDTATDGVVVLDNEGRILALNRSAEALFGYEQNEIAGEAFSALLANESHAAAEDYLHGLQANGVASVLNDGREVLGRARQGGAIPLFMTIGRVASGEASKFCAVLRDITQWKKAERELKDARREAERASALKSDFLAKISHEIRTPLNAILGFAEVIMDERFGPVGNERYKDYLKDIHASGTHVMSLVNDLLDLSKIEAGKVDLTFGAVDANKIINECVSLMQTQAIRERVIVRLALAPRLPNIVADERSLRQIVINLLSNALKFNEPGGQVIISTALTDAGNAVIRIKDTGIGMTDADVETALEPFRQIATSRQTTGTGLGLPLTKALVEANRAMFTIKSKKHEGTLVEVSFPSTRVLAE